MIQQLQSIHATIVDFLVKVGLGDYTAVVTIVLGVLPVLAMRAIYVAIVYRPLTPEEREHWAHDHEMIETLAKGRLRRWGR